MIEVQVQPLANFHREREALTAESHEGFKARREALRNQIADRLPLFRFYRDLLRWLFRSPAEPAPTFDRRPHHPDRLRSDPCQRIPIGFTRTTTTSRCPRGPQHIPVALCLISHILSRMGPRDLPVTRRWRRARVGGAPPIPGKGRRPCDPRRFKQLCGVASPGRVAEIECDIPVDAGDRLGGECGPSRGRRHASRVDVRGHRVDGESRRRAASRSQSTPPWRGPLKRRRSSRHRNRAPARRAGSGVLFWSGLAVGIAGVTTSALGLTALRTEDTSTGNAPSGTYLACVAQKKQQPDLRDESMRRAEGQESQAALGRRGDWRPWRRMMIGGSRTSAELSSGAIGIFHHVTF